jgi:outer membrane protein assembly factor BamE
VGHSTKGLDKHAARGHHLTGLMSIYSMRKTLFLSLLLPFLVLANGCVYQAALSQGNLLDQEDIDQVEVGMTRGQVRFLLGTPMIDDPFHEDRWDYVYYLRIGREKATFKRWISIMFDDQTVVDIIRDQELRQDL